MVITTVPEFLTTVNVTINDDSGWDGLVPETFYVILEKNLFSPSNYGIEDWLGEGAIVENDPQPPTVYEDAENSNTLGWSVYAGPGGAMITNVLDSDPNHGGSRVIELKGAGTNNCYVLRKDDGRIAGQTCRKPISVFSTSVESGRCSRVNWLKGE